jgi:UDP-N-acetylglucosamine/UDP-N-acetylgalactosamine diphosphorylase
MTQRTLAEWRDAGVDIADEVDAARISADVVIHSGCRIRGARTSIGPGCEIGVEAPATIENCQLGRNVALKGGFFSGSVFFDGSNVGSGAHIRGGTILEEEANAAHTVGLKQTILLPFVTLGSLINFCDILMAGGTSRKDHSEVGSSYIHFNYTPHQDKATASLVGDVADGVFLDRKPIFLGGQGGLVGPARIAYGSVIAAGGVCRKDILEEDQLHVPLSPKSTTRSYETGVYGKVDRIVKNNLLYIGNIVALKAWYQNVRPLFVRDAFDQTVLDGGIANLELVLAERIKRLDDLAEKMKVSIQWLETNNGAVETVEAQKRFQAAWPEIKKQLDQVEFQAPSAFIEALPRMDSYIKTIQSLESSVRESGRAWLQSIVTRVEQLLG